jgi:hypothetical protein
MKRTERALQAVSNAIREATRSVRDRCLEACAVSIVAIVITGCGSPQQRLLSTGHSTALACAESWNASAPPSGRQAIAAATRRQDRRSAWVGAWAGPKQDVLLTDGGSATFIHGSCVLATSSSTAIYYARASLPAGLWVAALKPSPGFPVRSLISTADAIIKQAKRRPNARVDRRGHLDLR